MFGFAFHNMSSNSDIGIALVYGFPISVTLAASLVAFGIIRPDKIPWMMRIGQVIKRHLTAYWEFNLKILKWLTGQKSVNTPGRAS